MTGPPLPLSDRAGPGDGLARLVRWARLTRRMVLLAIVAALVALAYLWGGGAARRAHIVIALAAGVGFVALLGTGWMLVALIGMRRGRDGKAARTADGAGFESRKDNE